MFNMTILSNFTQVLKYYLLRIGLCEKHRFIYTNNYYC